MIQNDDLERFEDLMRRVKVKQHSSIPNSSDTQTSKIDEFRLLTEIVKLERVNFLQVIAEKGLFPITQKDEYTGDNLLHYAVMSKKASFILRFKPLFENEINNKNEQGNTPFHFACLLGNLDLVQALVGR